MSLIKNKERLVLEYSAMKERWGDRAVWCCNSARTKFWWDYTITGCGNEMPIRILYPESYPSKPPTIRVMCDLPPSTPHLLPHNTMCWIYPGERRRTNNKWDPARDTAAVAVGAAHRWYMAFMVWITTGRWPVKDAKD